MAHLRSLFVPLALCLASLPLAGRAQAPAKTAAKPTPAAPSAPATGTGPAAPTPGAPAPAILPRAPVYCGTFTCFFFRTPLGIQSPEDRASYAMDVINKYLGGAVGKVTSEVRGKSIRVLLNGDLVAVVSPGDASVEKQKTVALLAAKWTKQLAEAFQASKAQR